MQFFQVQGVPKKKLHFGKKVLVNCLPTYLALIHSKRRFNVNTGCNYHSCNKIMTKNLYILYYVVILLLLYYMLEVPGMHLDWKFSQCLLFSLHLCGLWRSSSQNWKYIDQSSIVIYRSNYVRIRNHFMFRFLKYEILRHDTCYDAILRVRWH